jgi:hypothetical protein
MSADVWEESEGADVCEGVGEGEDVAADRYWCGIFLLSMILMMVELVDVKDDFVWSLRRNRRNDEMAIIEEGENHVVMAAYSNRLCDDAIQIKVRLSSVFAERKKKVPFSHG